MSSEKPSFSQLMKMAKDMTENMEKMQQDMAQKSVTATAGTGDTTVTVEVNGLQEFTLKAVGEGAKQAGGQVCAELAISAANQALEKIREVTKNAMMDLYQQSSGKMNHSDEE